MKLIARWPIVNVHLRPDRTTEQVTQLRLGEPAEVIETFQDWIMIEGPDRYRGWAIRDDLVEPVELTGPAMPLRVADPFVNLRAAADFRSGPVMLAPMGAVLPCIDESGDWCCLGLPNGPLGWVETDRVEPNVPRPLGRDAVISTARELLGTPYLWGGTSAFGIDCSGFVQFVLGLHGIALPRDAHDQSTMGRTIDLSAVRPGDLLYFGAAPVEPRDRITHVAMVCGPSRILHALGGRAVVETDVSAGGTVWGARDLLADGVH